MHKKQSGSTLRSTLITVGIIVVALAIAATLLPRGFSDDASVIGQGTPAVVLVHNKESMLSLNLMTLMNRVRPDYGNDVNFIVVDIVTDNGRAFLREYQFDDNIRLIFFDGAGVQRDVVPDLADESHLRRLINDAFSLNVR